MLKSAAEALTLSDEWDVLKKFFVCIFFSLISSKEATSKRSNIRKNNKKKHIKNMDAKLEFVTVGANRFSDCASWNSKYEILAYGGGSLINIWTPLVCINSKIT